MAGRISAGWRGGFAWDTIGCWPPRLSWQGQHGPECVLRSGPSVQAYKAVVLIGERRAREPGSFVSRIHIDDRSSPDSWKLCRVRVGGAAASNWLAFLR